MSSAAVVGTFDGLHRGHRFLLDHLCVLAGERGLTPRVYTFSSHPRRLLTPGQLPPALVDTEQKLALIRRAGIDDIRVADFADIRPLTARQFLEKLAAEGVTLMLIGHDNRFGSDGLHTLEQFREAAAGTGIDIVQAPELTVGDSPVSSSAIRALIADGDIAAANELLGYRFTIAGTVIHGHRLGHKIGFPTANVEPSDHACILPRIGVYAAIAETPEGIFPAMVNIGRRPTVDSSEAPVTIEAHIIGLDADLYGSRISLQMVSRLRSERRFDSLEALRSQLEADRRATLHLLGDVTQ